MKQIFVGSTQRAKLHTAIRKATLPTRIILGAVFALLLIIPVGFHETIFTSNGDGGKLSPVAKVSVSDGSGSAIYIGHNMMLTAAHVVSSLNVNDVCDVEFQNPNDGADTWTLRAKLIDSGNYNATENPYEDCAVLELLYVDVDKSNKVPKYVPYQGTPRQVVGDAIVVEGYPNGNYRKLGGTISSNQIPGFYEVTAQAWHGASGGALLNQNNEVIGIVLSISQQVNMDGGIHFSPITTYAIKIDEVRKRLHTGI